MSEGKLTPLLPQWVQQLHLEGSLPEENSRTHILRVFRNLNKVSSTGQIRHALATTDLNKIISYSVAKASKFLRGSLRK